MCCCYCCSQAKPKRAATRKPSSTYVDSSDDSGSDDDFDGMEVGPSAYSTVGGMALDVRLWTGFQRSINPQQRRAAVGKVVALEPSCSDVFENVSFDSCIFFVAE